MDQADFVQWLKAEGLFHLVDRNFRAFLPVLSDCLKVHKEFVLIIGDLGYKDRRVAALMSGCYLLAAKRLGLKYKLVIQQPKKVHSSADDLLIQALRSLNERNVIVMAISGKLGSMKALGKSFRRHVKSQGHRFASTISLQELSTDKFSCLVSAVNIDYAALQAKGKVIKEKIDHASELRLVTSSGTDLVVDIRRKFAVANTGDYSNVRSGGNIPCGEVYIAPRGRNANGRVVIDASIKIRDDTVLVKTPVVLTVRDSLVVAIEGAEEAGLFRKSLAAAEKAAKFPWGIRRLAEVGIGINQNATIAGPTIINEKVLGTAHIATGSNVWFGGTVFAVTHFDLVMRNPTVYLDKRRLVV
ncbi:MAG: aminopeptidase [Candidatus Woesearchaeota archaeon]